MVDFELPFSGKILGHLVEALGLRQWDIEGTTLSGRTATRLFGGDRVDQKAQAAILEAIGNAVVASGILPREARLADPEAQQDPIAVAAARVGLGPFLSGMLAQFAAHWDALVGAIHRYAPSVAYVSLARGAALRLLTIDIAVRLSGLLWLMGYKGEHSEEPRWARERGMASLLRDLQARCSPSLSRDDIARVLRVRENTVDSWLDTETRPSDENLQDLANLFSCRGLGDREVIVRHLRLGYGLHDLFERVQPSVGAWQAADCAIRIAAYPICMLELPRRSRNPGEVDFKARMLFAIGTLGRERLQLPFVQAMLRHVWRSERDPVWRTALKAATRSWLDHLAEVATRLAPTAEEEFASIFGAPAPAEVQERLAYFALASKEEWAREPGMAKAMDAELMAGGGTAALELKCRAVEAERKGDTILAIDLVRAAVEQDPSDPETHFWLGSWLWQLGDAQTGLHELEIAVALDPSWDRAQTEIAIVLLNLGHNEEAVRRLERARPLLRAPSAWLLLHLAHGHERLDNVERAMETYQELVDVDLDHGEALDRLAHLCFVRGDKRKGAELAKKAAHFGFTDVLSAWKSGYYEGEIQRGRPPRSTPDHLVQLCDLPCLRLP